MKALLEHVENKIREIRRQLRLLKDAKRKLKEEDNPNRR
jgi:hypothetical protein